MSTATRYRHAPGCRREDMDEPRIGREGDVLRRCNSCRMLTVEKAPEPEQAPAVLSLYRCRAHPEQPVSWRGTGCEPCAAERERSRAERRRRRQGLAQW